MAEQVLELINDWPGPQQTIGKRLREMILDLDAGLKEDLKWNAPAYYLEENICSIRCHKDHVNLQFFKGADLSDPDGILEGTGKSMRHIKIFGPDEIKSKHVSGFLRQAAGL